MAWLPDIVQHTFIYERASVTPFTFSATFVPPWLGLYVMAILVQLPRTRLYRASLLPAIYWLTFRAGMSLDFSRSYPGYAFFNQGLVLAMFTISMRSTAWVFAPRSYTRLPLGNLENRSVNDDIPAKHGTPAYSVMWNAWDLIVNNRCIGWDGPPKITVSAPYIKVESRLIFCLLSLCRFVFLELVFDAFCGCIRSFGPDTFGTPKGGTIFDPSLAPTERYMKSAFITLLSGFTGYLIIEAMYQLHAALFTILFWQRPSQWPPLFDYPWLSTSLSSFWGQRWHQFLRESFVVLGSKPGERYFGRVGSVMGAFAISGILHDIGMRGMGHSTGTLAVVGFFLMQGVGVVMEHAWKRITGRRVGGLAGWLWTCFWLVSWGQLIVDVWARSGLYGSEFFPEGYRPAPLLLNWMGR